MTDDFDALLRTVADMRAASGKLSKSVTGPAILAKASDAARRLDEEVTRLARMIERVVGTVRLLQANTAKHANGHLTP